MPTTPQGIWYPNDQDSTRIWELMQEQAESIDPILGDYGGRLDDIEETLELEPGVVTLGGNVSAANGEGATVRRRGKVVDFRCELVTTATIAADHILCTLPIGFRPAMRRRQPTATVIGVGSSVALITAGGDVRLPFIGVPMSNTVFISDTWVV